MRRPRSSLSAPNSTT
uniref:Uncharacterized protein n=1 Tax=Arundo donax TaxID=35708 RepID=A0A0A9HPQ2_ARUDO